MSCYISSNQNRVYAALESAFGEAAGVAGGNRLTAASFTMKERRVASQRNDKTGGRTYSGAPSNGRESTEVSFSSYITEWDSENGVPALDPALQAVMGGSVLVSTANTIQAISGDRTITTSQAHGLSVGQGIACGGEIRFVDAVVDAYSFALNFPFGVQAFPGADLRRTVTYTLGDDLKSMTLYDYWDPQGAVQRGVAGVCLDELRMNVNGDFHELLFAGEGRRYFDSVSFEQGVAGLTEYPPEPLNTGYSVGLIPGSIGQAWVGGASTMSQHVLTGGIRLSNNVDFRCREFGPGIPGCIAAGAREVRLDLRLSASSSTEMAELFLASRNREPIPVMFQLGATPGQLSGYYMSGVVLESAVFDDTNPRLEWAFRNARAQGIYNDELSIAFA